MTSSEYPGERHLVFWREHLSPPHSFVYVMQVPGESLFKVGYSVDPFQRLATLGKRYSGLRLRYVYPGSRAFEKLLQRKGLQCHNYWCGRGEEWFDASEEEGLQFLLLLEGLAYAMIEAYDGSGQPPVLPAFDSLRSDEDTRKLHSEIEKWILDGYSLAVFRSEYEMSANDLNAELMRMYQSGEYHCFFEYADSLPRGPKPKSFKKLGHKHRYGGAMAFKGEH